LRTGPWRGGFGRDVDGVRGDAARVIGLTLSEEIMEEREFTVSVLIPCFNELHTVENVIARVRAVPVKTEIILVDDCSRDGTRDLLERLAREDPALKVSFHERNRGKGAAIRTALSMATGDVTIVQDADMEYDPQEYPLLLEPMLKRKADVVFGSRFLGSGPHRVVYFWHMVGNQVLTLLSNMFTNINLSDMETCYKLFRREIIQSLTLEEDRFGFEPEVTAKVARIPEIRIYEVGISYYGRTYAEGKKIGWRDGFRAIYAIIKYNVFR